IDDDVREVVVEPAVTDDAAHPDDAGVELGAHREQRARERRGYCCSVARLPAYGRDQPSVLVDGGATLHELDHTGPPLPPNVPTLSRARQRTTTATSEVRGTGARGRLTRVGPRCTSRKDERDSRRGRRPRRPPGARTRLRRTPAPTAERPSHGTGV